MATMLKNSLRLWLSNVYNKKCFLSLGFFLFQNVSYFLDSPRTYSTNIGTEYFKHGVYSPFFSLQNAVCFIILTYLVPVLLIFYIQVC